MNFILSTIIIMLLAFLIFKKEPISITKLVSGEYSVNRRLKEIFFEKSVYGVVATDLNFKILMWNQRSTKKFGYTEEEMIGKTIDVIIPAINKINIESVLNNDDGIVINGVNKNGVEFPVHLKLIEINDNGFKSLGWFLRNITKDKAVEKILMDELELLREGEKCACTGSWHWNLLNNPKKIVQVSENFYNVFSVEKSRIITSDLLMELVYPKDQVNTAVVINEAIENKKNYVAEYRRKIENGDLRLIKVIGCFVFDDENEIVAITGTVQKIKDGVDGS